MFDYGHVFWVTPCGLWVAHYLFRVLYDFHRLVLSPYAKVFTSLVKESGSRDGSRIEEPEDAGVTGSCTLEPVAAKMRSLLVATTVALDSVYHDFGLLLCRMRAFQFVCVDKHTESEVNPPALGCVCFNNGW